MLTGLSVDVFVWYLTVALKLTHKINLQRRIAWFSLDVTAVFSCFFCDGPGGGGGGAGDIIFCCFCVKFS